MLRKTGLLVLEKRGRFRVYRTDPAQLRAVTQALDRLAEEVPAAGAELEG